MTPNKGKQMANTKSTTLVAEATEVSTTTTKQDTPVLVVIPAKTQRAVKRLALAHEAEKKVKARVAKARNEVLDELNFGVNVIGTDAEGKRLVKVTMVAGSDKIDTKALMDFLLKHHPEIHAEAIKHYYTPAGEPTPRVLTI
jgi:hypothetical protein